MMVSCLDVQHWQLKSDTMMFVIPDLFDQNKCMEKVS